jgi:excisionase family DNA binding protein
MMERAFMEPKISEAERQRRARQRAMSVAQFCQNYGTGRTTAYQEIKAGRLRARKCGKRTIISEDDAENWLGSLPFVPAALA